MPPMSSQGFQVTGRPGGDSVVHILRVTGAITHITSSAFQDAVYAVASPRLIIDLSEVPSVDSMAVGALVRSYVFCNKAQRRLALAGLNHRVRNVLRLTGVDSLFETYPTIADAESALS